MDTKKNEAEAKQLGDFGERLVIFMLTKLFGYKALYVDHEGADIVATKSHTYDRSFAISVKSRIFSKAEGFQHSGMDLKQLIKLSQFAYDFNQIPAIAYVCIPYDLKFIDIYIASLDTFNSAVDIEKSGISRTYLSHYHKGKKELGIDAYAPFLRLSDANTNREFLQNNENILYARFIIETNCSTVENIKMNNLTPDNYIWSKTLLGNLVQKENLDFMYSLYNYIESERKENREVSKETIKHIWNTYDLPISEGLYIDGNLKRQFGDFGERMVMYIIGQMKGYKVAYVDYEGADVIATDKTGNTYAISVKSVHNSKYTFDGLNINKLCRFSEDFKMIPTVAFVFVSNSLIDVFVLKLEELEKLAMSTIKTTNLERAFSPQGTGYQIDCDLLRNEHTSHINHIQLTISNKQIDADI